MENIHEYENTFMVFRLVKDNGTLELMKDCESKEEAMTWLKSNGLAKTYYTITEVFRKQ